MAEHKPGRYHHFKGNDYELLYNARHSETLEPLVVYRALYGDSGVWVRPAGMWDEPVQPGGAQRRFSYTGPMDITLRPEEPSDAAEAEFLTREAFWNAFKPGCDEHYLLHVMRSDPSFIPELNFVAEQNGRIIGSIVYTKSSVTAPDGRLLETVTFGPVSVLPAYQKSGVGSRLIFHTLELAKKLGHQAVIILGHPDYYPRFGFRPGRDFGLTLQNGETFDAFMALELAPGSLDGGGVYHYAEIYNIDPASSAEFDKAFPYKEKKAT